jgi:hypothetical protein
MLSLFITAIWIPLLLSGIVVFLAHKTKSIRLLIASVPLAWTGQYLYIYGVPSLPPSEASQWLFYLLPLIPLVKYPTYRWVFSIGIFVFFTIFFSFQLSSVVSKETIVSALLLPSFIISISTALLDKSTDSSDIFVWALCTGVATIVIAETGSLIYAKLQLSVCIGLLILALYELFYPNKQITQNLNIVFVLFLILPLVLAYQFSFLPWYTAGLVVLLPIYFSVPASKFIQYVIFIIGAILALWSPFWNTQTTLEDNPYEHL